MTSDPEPRLGPAEPSGFQWLDEPADPAPAEAGAAPAPTTTCPRCGARVGAEAFCESCGASLEPGAASATADGVPAPAEGTSVVTDAAGMLVLGGPPPQPGVPGEGMPPGGARTVEAVPGLAAELPLPNGGICPDCGGTFDGDGYCEQCGAKAADPREHFELAAGPWVGGVCDRGVRHPDNEDALALRAQASPAGGLRAALVVCDGVSTAPRSAQAALAAAQTAVEVLSASRARGLGVKEALIGALTQRLEAATDAAHEAVVAVGALPPGPGDVPSQSGHDGGGPSCTLVAAAVEDRLAVIGNVGDSRAYWFPDHAPAALLTTDDSWAAEAIREGADRAEAESGPHAHTITRWLGADSPNHTPRATTLEVSEPGWLLLCSDGLWNYASEAARLAEVLARAVAADGEGGPVAIARRLVEWAKEQGGHDNITVALARLQPAPAAGASDPPGVPSQERPGPRGSTAADGPG